MTGSTSTGARPQRRIRLAMLLLLGCENGLSAMHSTHDSEDSNESKKHTYQGHPPSGQTRVDDGRGKGGESMFSSLDQSPSSLLEDQNPSSLLEHEKTEGRLPFKNLYNRRPDDGSSFTQHEASTNGRLNNSFGRSALEKNSFWGWDPIADVKSLAKKGASLATEVVMAPVNAAKYVGEATTETAFGTRGEPNSCSWGYRRVMMSSKMTIQECYKKVAEADSEKFVFEIPTGAEKIYKDTKEEALQYLQNELRAQNLSIIIRIYRDRQL